MCVDCSLTTCVTMPCISVTANSRSASSPSAKSGSRYGLLGLGAPGNKISNMVYQFSSLDFRAETLTASDVFWASVIPSQAFSGSTSQGGVIRQWIARSCSFSNSTWQRSQCSGIWCRLTRCCLNRHLVHIFKFANTALSVRSGVPKAPSTLREILGQLKGSKRLTCHEQLRKFPAAFDSFL